MKMKALLPGFYCRCILGIAVLGFAIPLSIAADSPNERLTPADVLLVMERVADWQLAHPSVHPSTEWTQSAGDAGMMALAGISGNPKYRDAMLAMGQANGWKPGPRIYHADDLAIGQAYAGLYFLYRDPKMIAPLRTRLDAVLSAPPAVQTLDFHQPYDQVSQLWSWCDSLFMAPPVWMQVFAATGDERYLDFAVKNWWRTTDYLYDPVEHLYFRDSTYFDRREANGKKIFWSRGNGWVMAGLVRMLQLLPANHPSRARFQQLFQEMAEKILTAQQPDGLWHSSLLDPQSYPPKETSGSAFYAYALAWGVNQGLLDGAKFKPAVLRAWTALAECVDAEGRLTHVQPIGADPKTFADDSTEVYGVGAFLLAGSELYRMAVFEKTVPLAIRVTNSIHLYRHCETVELSLSRLASRGLRATNLAAMDGLGSRILDSQIYASESGHAPDTFLFQVDLAPGDTRTYYVLDTSALAAVPQPIVKTYARQIDERYRDIAWESDRIAHRIYHQDLIAAEGTVSSGVDVWVKSTRALVINKWYKKGDYHNDHGEGLDDYRVGRSRGCGGLGIWEDHTYYVSSNYKGARVMATGPIRSEFELTYDAWETGKHTISETERITIDAGSNMTRAESLFAADRHPDFDIGIGIARRPGDGVIAKDQEMGWMSYWQAADRDRGNIACAIVIPGKIDAFAIESATLSKLKQADLVTPTSEGLPPVANLLAISAAQAGKPFLYYFGAGWSKSGDFPEETDWENYVRQFVVRLRAPLKVTLENE
ncbi:MAG: glycoside hydrolase family 88 protein [Candidatus Sulfotelmatobacter sp.]